jgi:Tfp pilus assembly protein PilF
VKDDNYAYQLFERASDLNYPPALVCFCFLFCFSLVSLISLLAFKITKKSQKNHKKITKKSQKNQKLTLNNGQVNLGQFLQFIKGDETSLNRARVLFASAVKLDSAYGTAWFALAYCYEVRWVGGVWGVE